MLEVFLVFRLAYVIDSETRVPVAMKSFRHRNEAFEYVKEHGGFMLPVLIDPNSDLGGPDEHLPKQGSGAMMRDEMGNRS
jgi:hypothetical protein